MVCSKVAGDAVFVVCLGWAGVGLSPRNRQTASQNVYTLFDWIIQLRIQLQLNLFVKVSQLLDERLTKYGK